VTAEGSGHLILVNFRSGEVTRVIATDPHRSHMVALSADGSRALTSNGGTNSASVYDVASGNLVKDIAVPDRPEAVTTNRAGTELWIGSNDEEVVTVFDVATASVIAQWDGFDWPYRILLTRDERYAIIPDLGNEQLRIYDVASKTELGRMELEGMGPQGVVLHPDDRTLFLSLSGRDQVLAIDIRSRQIKGIYNTGSAPDGIAYSPLVLR
ncbi:MAG: YncE family protein, partial [Gammaproteobacteria bacterium]